MLPTLSARASSRVHLAITVLFVALAFNLTACGDDASEEGDANGSTSTNAGTTSTNNATTSTNNATTSTNNATTSTNNSTTSTNNASTGSNNASTGTNNATTSTNNSTTSTNNATTVDPDLWDVTVLTSDYLTSQLVRVSSDVDQLIVLGEYSGDSIVVRVDDAHHAVLDRAEGFLEVFPHEPADASPMRLDGLANPYDIKRLPDGTFYVAQYNSAELLHVAIGDDGDLEVIGSFDLSEVVTDDTDGNPNAVAILVEPDSNFAHVVLQVLDAETFAPAGNAVLASLDTQVHGLIDWDPDTDAVDGIELPLANPFFVTEDADGAPVLGMVGNFGAADGGLLRLNYATQSTELLVSEELLGVDIASAAAVPGGWLVVGGKPDFSGMKMDHVTGEPGAWEVESLIDIDTFALGALAAWPEVGLVFLAFADEAEPGVWYALDDALGEPVGLLDAGELPPRTMAVRR